MWDVEANRRDESDYECFACGVIVTDSTHPGECPECGGNVRNRSTPLE